MIKNIFLFIRGTLVPKMEMNMNELKEINTNEQLNMNELCEKINEKESEYRYSGRFKITQRQLCKMKV